MLGQVTLLSALKSDAQRLREPHKEEKAADATDTTAPSAAEPSHSKERDSDADATPVAPALLGSRVGDVELAARRLRELSALCSAPRGGSVFPFFVFDIRNPKALLW
jgi:hypothetical protein